MPNRIVALIEWIGGQGTRAVVAVLFLGLALPPLSAIMRPLLPLAVFVLFILAFTRVDTAAVAMRVRRPRLALLATVWMMLAMPIAFAGGLALLEPLDIPDELAAGLVLMAVAPPIMSSPAFTYLLGLDGALSVTVLVASMIVTPITAPILVDVLIGEWVGLSARDLAIRLALLLAGSFIAALAVRRWLGEARIAANGRLIDGLNILILFVFAVAIMDGVIAYAIRDPLLILAILALAFAVNLLLLTVSAIAFLLFGIGSSLTVGIANANRNMGLMAAVMAGAVPEVTWLFFALAQFPIFLMPQLTRPAILALLARYNRADDAGPQSN